MIKLADQEIKVLLDGHAALEKVLQDEPEIFIPLHILNEALRTLKDVGLFEQRPYYVQLLNAAIERSRLRYH